MKYLLLQAEPRGELERIGADEQSRRVQHHQQALAQLLRTRVTSGRRGLIYATAGLGPFHGGEHDTVTVKNRGGRYLRVDGPFPETKEVLGGFNLIDFESRAEAIEFAKAQHIHEHHVTETRPIRELWWIAQSLGAATSKVFMLASIEDERAVLRLPESDRKQLARQHQAVGAEYVAQRGMLNEVPGLWVGGRLCPSAEATTIRWTGGGRQVTDGPFADTKELIGAFNLVACASIDEAIGWAEKLAVHDGAAIEVRPVDGGCWWVYHE